MPQPPGPSGRAFPVLPVILIGALFLFGVDTMFGQLSRNGYFELSEFVLADGLSLPGSNRSILRHYVGVPAVDNFMTTINVFWANVVDGSRPELSLFVFFFGSQLVAFFLVFMIESQRVARWSPVLFNPLVWGFAMQALGYGIVAPVFFALHLAVTSRLNLSDTVRLRDPTSLHTVVPAFLLGYVLLCCALAYPFSHSHARQWANAVWQTFPLHVLAWQALFTGIVKRTSLGQDAFTAGAQLDRAALSHAYGFAWNVAVTGQLCTAGVLLTSAVFPGLYPAGVARSLTLGSVFGPGLPHSSTPMVSPAAAIHEFFKYDLYVGSAVTLVWAVYLLSQVRPVLSTSEERGNLARGIMTSLILSGPGGAVVALLQHRDETVLAAELKAEKSK
ncbi:hypothetical protein AK830_g1612 [Neonectria ditissima]|uniref:Uncharacterized protein n=1 Tax=Neonectria ditissima TaxID=78410 RepID=A0A0P7BI55_9HYPO|nr:hypothetical protein AK830_g1612 [Neonectria ditissima]